MTEKENMAMFVLEQRLASKGNHNRYLTALRTTTSMVLLKCEKKLWDHWIRSHGDYFEEAAKIIFIVGEFILLHMYQISKYRQPSFATVLQRALLYTS
jgi:hypothetical protein